MGGKEIELNVEKSLDVMKVFALETNAENEI
jgi:hypothetical protein